MGASGNIMQLDRAKGEVTTIAAAENPEGITIRGGTLLWTEFTSGNIEMVSASGGSKQTLVLGALGKRPYRIVSDGTYTCWTNEGVGESLNGSVECVGKLVVEATATPIAEGQSIPRAIALDSTGVYWATFDKQGAIYWAPRDTVTDAFLDDVRIIDGQAYPNGLAVDAEYIYWTNWGDGTVWRLAKSAMSSPPQMLASGQQKPADIAVGDTHIVWVNEGSSVSSGMGDGASIAGDGAVVKLKKPQ
jgi:hypothetical protein